MKKLIIFIVMILIFTQTIIVNASEQFEITNIEVTKQTDASTDVEKDECFIATATYGSKYQQPVTLLREFRDKNLLTNSIGTKFVTIYYENSPPIANYIAENEILKFIVKILLIPLIIIAWLMLNPIYGMCIIGIIFWIIGIRQRKNCIS